MARFRAIRASEETRRRFRETRTRARQHPAVFGINDAEAVHDADAELARREVAVAPGKERWWKRLWDRMLTVGRGSR